MYTTIDTAVGEDDVITAMLFRRDHPQKEALVYHYFKLIMEYSEPKPGR